MTGDELDGGDEPTPVVFLERDEIRELLENANVVVDGALIDSEGEELARRDVELVSLDGQHWLYDETRNTSSRPSSDDDLGARAKVKRAIGHALPIVATLALTSAFLTYIPEGTLMTVDGEAVTFPPSGATMWATIAMVALVAGFLAIAFPHLPRKAGGRP